ncbi:basic phospholipase A2 taipoxin alpha chain-like [Pocillopora verrucosa]|uniref:basic phospholipase A2 taipoxin alpha chain-like n=1 Tax=Pocillopora verrucosa TaxID=203993 RepID=UPI0033429741
MKSLAAPAIFLIVSSVVCVLSLPSLFKERIDKPSLERKQTRNLYQFGLMIWCATSRSPWDYYDYGCWCGYGGSGTPVDDTDRCCQIHDSCYDVLVNNSICSTWWKPYFLNYLFTPCHKCDPESSYPSDEVDVTCKRALCECDSQATKCFANSTFNAANIDYDTSKC